MNYEIRVFVPDGNCRLCKWRQQEIIQINVPFENVPLVLEMPPNASIGSTEGFLKGKNDIQVFSKIIGTWKTYWGQHFWTSGYFVSTVGVDEGQVVKDVRWQQRQHQNEEQQNLVGTTWVPHGGQIRSSPFGDGRSLVYLPIKQTAKNWSQPIRVMKPAYNFHFAKFSARMEGLPDGALHR